MTLKLLIGFCLVISSSVSFAEGEADNADEVFQLRPRQVEKAAPPKEKRSDKKTPLTAEEIKILERGPISTSSYIIGGLLGTYPGLGIGHMVQGRFSTQGWKYTVGEVLSALLVMTSIDTTRCTGSLGTISKNRHCTDRGRFTTGAALYVGFRIWEIFDVWAKPPKLQHRYREIKKKSTTQNVSLGFLPGANSIKVHLGYNF